MEPNKATLSERFAAQRSTTIECDGITVHGLFEFRQVPEQFRVTFLEYKVDPVQGLNLIIRGGTLAVAGVESSNILLWQDTAPSAVDIEVQCRDINEVSLKVWNVWRGGMGAVQAWLGNAAMLVEEERDAAKIALRCSDGLGDPNFSDLVAEITLCQSEKQTVGRL